jgi:hypothetical protein
MVCLPVLFGLFQTTLKHLKRIVLPHPEEDEAHCSILRGEESLQDAIGSDFPDSGLHVSSNLAC